MEPVSAVLAGRARARAGMSRTLAASTALHVAALVVLVAVPIGRGQRPDDLPRTVMTISLGGSSGPRTGGANPIGGRPIQAVAPLPRPPAPRVVMPAEPAPRTPAMTAPAPDSKPVRKPAGEPARVASAPDDAKGRKPIVGDEEAFGSAVAQTGGTGFGGLTTGAGGGTPFGYLDVGNFCCPDYLATMQRLIHANWNWRQQVAGSAQLRFVIQHDGRIAAVSVERSSGYAALDLAAQRALVLTRLPALPAAFTDDSLTVHLIFDYQR